MFSLIMIALSWGFSNLNMNKELGSASDRLQILHYLVVGYCIAVMLFTAYGGE